LAGFGGDPKGLVGVGSHRMGRRLLPEATDDARRSFRWQDSKVLNRHRSRIDWQL
jgi:hypothetical protein